MAVYFSDEEVEGLSPTLVALLDYARQLAGVPFVITSGYRSPDHNADIGGVPNSAHTRGLAADIRCSDSVSRYKIVKALLKVGFRRIEIAPRHVHVDLDGEKPQDVLFLGGSK